MISLFLLVRRFFKALKRSAKEPDFKGLISVVALTIIAGVIFYMNVENLKFVDAIYFCFVTLLTVGYGDITPQTDLGKIFTIFYMLLGIGIILTFINMLARNIVKADGADGK